MFVWIARWFFTMAFMMTGLFCFLASFGALLDATPPNWLAAVIAASFGGVLLFISDSQKCPKCRLGIYSQGYGGYGPGYRARNHCPRCLRTRKDVWPLQYLIKPEKWDGVDHIDYS